MQANGLRSPFQNGSGLYHFARMLDKIRIHQAGRLPEEYHPNFGLRAELDGHLCGFLGVEHADVCERVRQGGSDEDVAQWCFQREGVTPKQDADADLERICAQVRVERCRHQVSRSDETRKWPGASHRYRHRF